MSRARQFAERREVSEVERCGAFLEHLKERPPSLRVKCSHGLPPAKEEQIEDGGGRSPSVAAACAPDTPDEPHAAVAQRPSLLRRVSKPVSRALCEGLLAAQRGWLEEMEAAIASLSEPRATWVLRASEQESLIDDLELKLRRAVGAAPLVAPGVCSDPQPLPPASS